MRYRIADDINGFFHTAEVVEFTGGNYSEINEVFGTRRIKRLDDGNIEVSSLGNKVTVFPGQFIFMYTTGCLAVYNTISNRYHKVEE